MWLNQNAHFVTHKVFPAISGFQYGVREIFYRMGHHVAWFDNHGRFGRNLLYQLS